MIFGAAMKTNNTWFSHVCALGVHIKTKVWCVIKTYIYVFARGEFKPLKRECSCDCSTHFVWLTCAEIDKTNVGSCCCILHETCGRLLPAFVQTVHYIKTACFPIWVLTSLLSELVVLFCVKTFDTQLWFYHTVVLLSHCRQWSYVSDVKTQK